jgi:hypothetical protein
MPKVKENVDKSKKEPMESNTKKDSKMDESNLVKK